MKTIIVVAKYYPPLTNARSIQAKLFVDALTLKYKVILITVRNGDTFESNNENLVIIRVGKPPVVDSYKVGFFKKIARKLIKEFKVTFGNAWSREVSKELINNLQYSNNVISLSEPFDSHLAVLDVYKKHDFNWLCFYSDPWPHSIMPKPYSNSALPLISKLQEFRSKKVLNLADAVLLTNNKAMQYIEKKLQITLQHKCNIVRHQMADIDLDSKSVEGDSYIVHIGHLSKERVNVKFFQCLVDSLGHLKIDRIKLVGRVCDMFLNVIKENQWEDYFELVGEVEQKQAINIAFSAKAVLLIEAEMTDSPFIPSKLAEYFNIPIPILCLTNQFSESSDLISNINNGVVVTHCMDDNEMLKLIASLNSIDITEELYSRAKGVFSQQEVIKSVSELLT
ncbi:hypothetical protein [Shewanella sp. HL-SH2]|uniref:hypothetical protein n=1 Tax=Shewanella sp. HL-SH2 TaxID=3436238 RepID=UPI003EBAF241